MIGIAEKRAIVRRVGHQIEENQNSLASPLGSKSVIKTDRWNEVVTSPNTASIASSSPPSSAAVSIAFSSLISFTDLVTAKLDKDRLAC